MKLSEAMRERILLSFELFPPKTEKGMDNLPGTIDHLMKYKPAYISCTYGAGGGNVGANREVCQMIKKAGTTPVTHFTAALKISVLSVYGSQYICYAFRHTRLFCDY